MKNYDLFLIDLDGTIYRGSQTIESGVRFVERLEKAGKKYLFLTNNSTRSAQMVVDKLKTHGVNCRVDNVYTTSMATKNYLLENCNKKQIGVYIIGQYGLKNEILGDPTFYLDELHPDFVIVGMDTDLTYHKVRLATKFIRQGAKFIGTNGDNNLPLGEELLPGNGSLCAMISVATGVKPTFIGKPERIIVDQALSLMQENKTNTLIVGDNYQTDIMAGINSQIDSLLTLTGVTQKADLVGKTAPTYIVDSLDDFEL